MSDTGQVVSCVRNGFCSLAIVVQTVEHGPMTSKFLLKKRCQQCHVKTIGKSKKCLNYTFSAGEQIRKLVFFLDDAWFTF